MSFHTRGLNEMCTPSRPGHLALLLFFVVMVHGIASPLAAQNLPLLPDGLRRNVMEKLGIPASVCNMTVVLEGASRTPGGIFTAPFCEVAARLAANAVKKGFSTYLPMVRWTPPGVDAEMIGIPLQHKADGEIAVFLLEVRDGKLLPGGVVRFARSATPTSIVGGEFARVLNNVDKFTLSNGFMAAMFH